MSRPRYTVAEARDIARHVITMRRCALELAHMRFHGMMFLGRNPFVQGYADHGIALTRHLGVSWLPLGLAAVALRRFNRTRIFDVSERILDRRGPCPILHEHATEGIVDIERVANGEEPLT